MRAFLCVVVLFVAGCSSPAQIEDDQEAPVDEPEPVRGDVYVTFRHPRSVNQDNYRYHVELFTPDGTKAAGAAWQHTGANCVPPDCVVREEGTNGDIQPRVYPTSAYDYIWFSDLAYAGNWSVNVTWDYNDRLGLHPGMVIADTIHWIPTWCMFVAVSEVGKTPSEQTLGQSGCHEEGVLDFSYNGTSVEFGEPRTRS